MTWNWKFFPQGEYGGDATVCHDANHTLRNEMTADKIMGPVVRHPVRFLPGQNDGNALLTI